MLLIHKDISHMPITELETSFPKQSGTGMPSLVHSSPLPNCRMIVYLNSLPLLELGTNLPRPSPGEVLSFLAFHQ